MKLYHSSDVSVPVPDTEHSRDFLDFGKGFYLTSIHEQAVRYAQRFIRRSRDAWLNAYEFEFNPSEWKVMVFDSYNKDWLDFIAKCRSGNDERTVDVHAAYISGYAGIQRRRQPRRREPVQDRLLPYYYTGLNAERLEASVIFDELTQNRFAQGNLIVRKINTSDNPADLITRLKAELGQ